MGLTQYHADNLDDKEFFFAALKNYIGESIFFIIVALVLYWLNAYLWWISAIACIILFIISAVSLLQSTVLLPKAFGAWNTVRFLKRHGTGQEIDLVLGDQTIEHQNYAFATAIISEIKSLIVFASYLFLGYVMFSTTF